MVPLKATLIDDDAFSLRAFPFTGPIPSPRWPGGVDLDGETFTARTDIKADWFAWRHVDWHHGNDPTGVMGRTSIGKAGNLRLQDDGWWVDVWLDAGEERVRLIKRLAEQGGAIFGSSEPIQDMVRVNKATGHIDVWPYLRQTLSTSPQNTHSILEPLKASLDGIYSPTEAFYRDVVEDLRDLVPDLLGAKAGQADDLSATLRSLDVSADRLRGLLTQRAKERDSGGHDP